MERIVNIGIGQGTLLGPLLFLVYINDLVNVSDRFSTVLFADDTCFTLSHLNYNILVDQMNGDLEKFRIWTLINRISVNLDKTFYICVSNRMKYVVPDEQIMFGGLPVKQEGAGKYLGMYVDSKLNFSHHISYVCSKLSRSIGILHRLRRLVPQRVSVNLYYCLIYPYLIYCNMIWGGAAGVYLNKLVVLQKRALRIISGVGFVDHTDPLFLSLKILKLRDIHQFILCQFMFKIMKSDGIETVYHGYKTRQDSDIRPSFCRLVSSQRCSSFSAPKAWNNIPLPIRFVSDIECFKRKLKAHFIDSYNQ